ncbi:MAG: M48 family metallopeptidase [Myxococcaceae bacterium]
MRIGSILAVWVVLTFGVSGCAGLTRSKAESTIARALISDGQEAQLGRQVRGELAKKGVAYVTNTEVTEYVREISEKLLPGARRDRPGVRWQVDVIDDAKTVNAFATPGGYLYVYTGLLLAAENEAEVAGVLGHEMAHVVARHSARQMVTTYGLQTVLGIALGNQPHMLAQLGTSIAANGYLLANSRGDETESDELGAKYASAAGYDPRGIASFFERLSAREGGSPGFMKWLSTHPPSAERVTHIERFIAERRLSGSLTAPERLQAIQAKVRALKPAAPTPASPSSPSPAQF